MLIDFGGVLTTSVLDAFRAFGEEECHDRDLPLRLLTEDEQSRKLLSAHEEGRLSAEEFETGFAARLKLHGATVEPRDLVARIQKRLQRDESMVTLVNTVRTQGIRVGLISNSFGSDTYVGWDLDSLFDSVTISGREGVRKPSRRLYQIACDRLGCHPTEIVMIDDLKQNIVAAERLGMVGITHRDAATTTAKLAQHLGRPQAEFMPASR
ncbi:HAD family phosphatase [Streptomyces enissocaesilis]|uniref:HAD family hydrolase n=1 Tax=Streptomyces enissocaesilis TaxID=332589 RepID=UPI0031D8AA8D